ncbi:MAG: nuclear transport factor 2 family protein [Bacteroidota bacterium]
MKQTSILLIMIASSFCCAAQDEKHLVESAVMDYVDAFYFGDSVKLMRSISLDVIKHGYSRRRDATTYVLDTMSFREMLDYVAAVKKRNNPEAAKLQKKVEVFDQLSKTASAKVTAWWGTDYILLAKPADKWMITHVLWQSPPPAIAANK